LAWDILSENLPLKRFDPIPGGVGGEQVELEASALWREGLTRFAALIGGSTN
jgi:hypothetical protein